MFQCGTGKTIETVRANIGLRCNLACHHCHVKSPPSRREEMTWEMIRLVLDAARCAKAALTAATVANLFLGVVELTDYTQFAGHLDKGDLVLIGTDVLTEARTF